MYKFNNQFYLGKHLIKNHNKPYIIAEVGSNFNQSLKLAFKYVDLCKKLGANCIKFQLFKASDLLNKDHNSFNIFLKNELPIPWLKKISDYSKKKKIDFMCSPFSISAVDQLKKINISSFKVASSELLNFNLLQAISKTKKPIILSTGMATLEDVKLSLRYLNKLKVKKIILLQCTSNYPTKSVDLHLNVIETYKSIFNNMPVGFSDHSVSFNSPALAVSKGACVIEKHITLNNKNSGPDHFYALNPKKFSLMIKAINEAHLSNGSFDKTMHFLEKKYGRKKSLYFIKNIHKGKKVKFESFLIKNSNKGISPKNIDLILNKSLKKNVKINQLVKKEDFQ